MRAGEEMDSPEHPKERERGEAVGWGKGTESSLWELTVPPSRGCLLSHSTKTIDEIIIDGNGSIQAAKNLLFRAFS